MNRRRWRIDDEGVTHYRLEFRRRAPVRAALIKEINGWRSLLHALGWIGQDPKRYRGVGFGNISRRLPGRVDNPRFIVTGSQTGKYPHLKPRHYSLVEKSFPQENRVMASGPSKPSSESMTHAIVYRLDPTAQVVIHVHAPLLWKNARRLGLPMTRRNVHYGTPEMAAEVIRLFKTRQLRTKKIFSMSGHLDGVISFGSTADEAGLRLIDYAMRSYSFHATTSS